jgi:hypothetical protein
MREFSTLEKVLVAIIAILVSIFLVISLFPEQSDNLSPNMVFSIKLSMVLLSTVGFILLGVRVVERIFIEFPKSKGYEKEKREYVGNMIIGIFAGVVVLLFDKLESEAPSELISLETVGFVFPSSAFIVSSIIVVSAGFLLYVVIQKD